MTDLIKLYNPANASALTPEDIAGLQKLESPQIKQLAQAYPNMTTSRSYLLIVDKNKPIEKQIPMLSTYENLWNLREKNAQRQYVPYGFRGAVKLKTPTGKARRTEVLDLSETELMELPGFRKPGTEAATAPVEVSKGLQLPSEVKVTKIKKVPKSKK